MQTQDISKKHFSVLLHELVDAISVHKDKQNIIVDATLGMAGHAIEMIQKLHPGDMFIGFDADIRNLNLAEKRLQDWSVSDMNSQNIHVVSPGCELVPDSDSICVLLIHANFVSLKQKLQEYHIDHITGIYYDLGISSLHVDEPDRGFSFQADGPLDMRFDTSRGKTAADIVNGSLQSELRDIFLQYGEEPQSTKIAAHIVASRKQQKILSTGELVERISEVSKHPKTKTRIFQALRIAVNEELENAKKSLIDAVELLDRDGTLFVISFHSLEDRIVKHLFKRESRDCICDDIICSCKHKKSLKIMTKKPILPSDTEIEQNSRSRSAKARYAIKIR